jgi:hypothetical protein
MSKKESNLDAQNVQQYRGNRKRLVIYTTDDVHARLVVKAQYDKIKQANFLVAVVEAYVNDDPDIRAFVEKNDHFKVNKRTIAKHKSEKRKIDLVNTSLNLDNEQVKEIFDFLEKDDYE